MPDFSGGTGPVTPMFGGEPAVDQATPSVPAAPEPYYSSPVYADRPAAPVAAVENGDFGDSAQGWKGSNAALTLVRGIEGKAIRVTRKGNRETFAFYAAKRLVSKKAGEPYKARAFIRTASPGMYLCLRVQEYGGGVPKTTERCAAAKSGWRRVALKGTAAGKGHKLVVSIQVLTSGGGSSFDVDGFRLGRR